MVVEKTKKDKIEEKPLQRWYFIELLWFHGTFAAYKIERNFVNETFVYTGKKRDNKKCLSILSIFFFAFVGPFEGWITKDGLCTFFHEKT